MIKRIKAHNFLSWKNLDVSFSDNETVSILGRCGEGKSAMLQTIPFALYGVARQPLQKLIYLGEEEMCVTLEYPGLPTHADTLKVERGVNKKGGFLKVYINDVQEAKGGADPGNNKAQKYLNDLLGIKFDDFILTSYFGFNSDKNKLLGVSPSETLESLQEIANISICQKYSEKANKQSLKLNTEIEKENRALEVLTPSYEDITTLKFEYDLLMCDSLDHAETNRNLVDKIEIETKKVTELKKLKSEYDLMEYKKAQIAAKQTKVNNSFIDKSDLEKEYNKIILQNESDLQNLINYTYDHIEYEKLYNSSREANFLVEEACSELQQISVSNDVLKSARKTLEKELDLLDVNIKAYRLVVSNEYDPTELQEHLLDTQNKLWKCESDLSLKQKAILSDSTTECPLCAHKITEHTMEAWKNDILNLKVDLNFYKAEKQKTSTIISEVLEKIEYKNIAIIELERCETMRKNKLKELSLNIDAYEKTAYKMCDLNGCIEANTVLAALYNQETLSLYVNTRNLYNTRVFSNKYAIQNQKERIETCDAKNESLMVQKLELEKESSDLLELSYDCVLRIQVINDSEDKLIALQGAHTNLKINIQKWMSSLQNIKEKITRNIHIKEHIDTLQTQIEDLSREKRALSLVAEGFSRYEIPLNLLKSIRESIETKATDIFQELHSGTVRIRDIEGAKPGVEFTVNDKDYFSLSEGQKVMLLFSVMVAVMQIKKAQHGRIFDFICLDEIAARLDEQSRNELIKVIDKIMKKYFNQVFIVSHVPLTNIFSKQIEIELIDEVSYVGNCKE